DEFAAITMHYQVNAFGRAAHEDTFLRLTGIDEALNFLARAFVGGRRFHAEIVHAAMNVRVFLLDVLRAAFNHHHGHLRGRGVVEIDQRLAVDSLAQHWKVFANTLDVPAVAGFGQYRN